VFLAVVVAALGGLIAGSALTIVAHRLAHGESLRPPRPRCPHCKHPLRPRDAIPLLSFKRLQGRCRDCGEPISRRYPLVEATCGVLFAAVVIARHDDGSDVILGLALVAFLIPLALVDLDTRELPNRLTLPAAIVAVVLGGLLDAGGEPERLLAGALAGGFFLVVALAFPTGMGIGDVKLAAVLGLFLGREVAAALLVALVAGVVVGAVIMRRKGVAEGRRTAVPFGPFLAFGGVVALLFGQAMVDAYVGTF
jgi:leader peptidase (prepilin peptidase)/N-methyltransferase